jgi:hypothetical protein
MNETQVLRLFLARMDNYGVSDIWHIRGRLYAIVMNDQYYNAVVLVNSYAYYEDRYHIASKNKPTLVICYEHDTVLPIPALSMRYGNYAKPYDLPEGIDDIVTQRHTRLGSKVFVGMYIVGIRLAQSMMKDFPKATRSRYKHRIEALNRRKQGSQVKTT